MSIGPRPLSALRRLTLFPDGWERGVTFAGLWSARYLLPRDQRVNPWTHRRRIMGPGVLILAGLASKFLTSKSVASASLQQML
jgi:hypothetical protein